jgi:hypothetical protein
MIQGWNLTLCVPGAADARTLKNKTAEVVEHLPETVSGLAMQPATCMYVIIIIMIIIISPSFELNADVDQLIRMHLDHCSGCSIALDHGLEPAPCL